MGTKLSKTTDVNDQRDGQNSQSSGRGAGNLRVSRGSGGAANTWRVPATPASSRVRRLGRTEGPLQEKRGGSLNPTPPATLSDLLTRVPLRRPPHTAPPTNSSQSSPSCFRSVSAFRTVTS